MARPIPIGFFMAIAVSVGLAGAQVTLATPENLWAWQALTTVSLGLVAIIGLYGVWAWWRGDRTAKPRSDVPPVAPIPAPAVTISSPTAPFSVRNLQHLTNEELRREVGNHADAMRAYEAMARGEDPSYARISRAPAEREEQDRASNRHRARVNHYFKTRLLPAAQALDHELRGRLGMGDPLADSMTDPSVRHNAHTIIRGHLAGPSPMTDAAGYLEMLARKLP